MIVMVIILVIPTVTYWVLHLHRVSSQSTQQSHEAQSYTPLRIWGTDIDCCSYLERKEKGFSQSFFTYTMSKVAITGLPVVWYGNVCAALPLVGCLKVKQAFGSASWWKLCSLTT